MDPSHSNFDCTKSTDTVLTLNCTPKLCLDIVIVGGGLCGLALAYNLQSGGHTVLVLERKEKVGMVCLSGAGMATAFLTHSLLDAHQT